MLRNSYSFYCLIELPNDYRNAVSGKLRSKTDSLYWKLRKGEQVIRIGGYFISGNHLSG